MNDQPRAPGRPKLERGPNWKRPRGRDKRPRKLYYDATVDRYMLHMNSLDNLTLARERNATKFTALCEAISNLARAGITRADDIALVTGASVPAIYRAKRRLSHGIETAVTVSHGIACDPLLA